MVVPALAHLSGWPHALAMTAGPHSRCGRRGVRGGRWRFESSIPHSLAMPLKSLVGRPGHFAQSKIFGVNEMAARLARRSIEVLLRAGLTTRWTDRAHNEADIRRVVGALLDLVPGDLRGKLVVAGFSLGPYQAESDPEIEQSCRTCNYFETHRRWCVLPALNLPAEPKWSCILWRV